MNESNLRRPRNSLKKQSVNLEIYTYLMGKQLRKQKYNSHRMNVKYLIRFQQLLGLGQVLQSTQLPLLLKMKNHMARRLTTISMIKIAQPILMKAILAILEKSQKTDQEIPATMCKD